MYIVTDYEILNGKHLSSGVIKGGFFETIDHINDYQRVLRSYFQRDYKNTITVYVNYKIIIKDHIKWV